MQALAKLCASVLLASALVACDEVDLYQGLSEREANEIVAILTFQNIEAQKSADAKKEFYTVRVAEESFAPAVELLRIQGYPRHERQSIGDVFQPSGLVPTPFEEQVRFVYAMNQELERTIALMQGVIDVRVHIVQAQPSQRSEKMGLARASVLVNYDSAHDFAQRIVAIRRLVSDAVSGIAYENVEVLATPIRTSIGSISDLQVRHILGIGVVTEDVRPFVISVLLGASLWLVTFLLLCGALYLFPGGWRAAFGALRSAPAEEKTKEKI